MRLLRVESQHRNDVPSIRVGDVLSLDDGGSRHADALLAVEHDGTIVITRLREAPEGCRLLGYIVHVAEAVDSTVL